MTDAQQDDVIELDDPVHDDIVDPNVVVLREDGATDEGLPDAAVLQDDGSIKLTLKRPVRVRFRNGSTGVEREEITSELVFNRMNGADMLKIGKRGTDKGPVPAIAVATRINEAKVLAIFERMDAADAVAAIGVIGFLLPSGRRTGS